jgi:phosphate transport system substrate-binding protein
MNVDYCTLASAKRDIEVRIGEDFICPECARPLKAPAADEAVSSNNSLALVGGGVALILILGGVYAGFRLSSGSSSAPPVAAVAPPAAVPVVAPAAPSPPPLTVLARLATSTTLGTTLAPRLAAAYLSYIGDTGIAAVVGSKPGEILVTGQRLARPEAIAIFTPVAGSPAADLGGFPAMAQGNIDLALSEGRATQPELDATRALGDLSSAANEHAVGFAGEAIIVSPGNPVSQLSMAQLSGILSGSIKTWSGVGGNNRPIHLMRQAGSASLAAIVPGAPANSPGERLVEDAAASVLNDPDALAVVPLARAGQAKQLAVAAVGAAPALPIPANIASEAYPIASRLYLYTVPSTTNPFVQRFAAFAVSAEGQAAIAQAGMVPLKVEQVAPPAPLTAKDRYKQLVIGTKRLAADLHFEPNSNKLDLRSSREVDRVWNFMMSDHTPSDHLIMIGFADNQGTPESNLSISKQRAQAVADVFARRGLGGAQVVSFGSDLPIADNSTEEGRAKNRRVEVYLKP